MIGYGHNRARRYGAASIEDLASAELRDWFVWDNLAVAAYERAGGDRQEAMALLARAISRLAEADEASLGSGNGKPLSTL